METAENISVCKETYFIRLPAQEKSNYLSVKEGPWKLDRSILLLLSKIKHSPKSAGIRKWTNLLYYNPNFVNLEMKRFDIIETDGCKFHVNDQINSVQRVEGNPWFDNIRPTDIAVDLGANIGAITIPLAKKAKKVYAIEPLYNDILLKNIALNELQNVTVFDIGIGERKDRQMLKFGNRTKAVEIYPFSSVKDMIGMQIDWLKMDIEGFEWAIDPEEFRGIKELRLEFHIRHGHGKEHRANLKRWLEWMDSAGYKKVVVHPHCCYDTGNHAVMASLEKIG